MFRCMNSPRRLSTIPIQIRVSALFRDRLEELRRSKRPVVPPLAVLVKEILEKALDESTKD
jgi:hypothetical protein